MYSANRAKIYRIILTILILLIIIFSITLIIRQRGIKKTTKSPAGIQEIEITIVPTLYPLMGSYKIDVSDSAPRVKKEFTAKVGFTVLDKNIFGTDVVLHFDPAFLKANPILETGDYFENYPRKTVDNQAGLIKLTAYGGLPDKMMTPANVFTVTFTALKTGTTTVSFDFEKRKTNLTTLVEKQTSRNILEEANPVQIVIGP